MGLPHSVKLPSKIDVHGCTGCLSLAADRDIGDCAMAAIMGTPLPIGPENGVAGAEYHVIGAGAAHERLIENCRSWRNYRRGA